jgi:hypothetical protein
MEGSWPGSALISELLTRMGFQRMKEPRSVAQKRARVAEKVWDSGGF